MNRINQTTMMRAEVQADVYSGPICSGVTTYFNMYCEGDMDSDDSTDDIIIELSTLPAGAIVTVTYPCCPNCHLPREDEFESISGGRMRIIGHADACECGFNWNNWIEEQYS